MISSKVKARRTPNRTSRPTVKARKKRTKRMILMSAWEIAETMMKVRCMLKMTKRAGSPVTVRNKIMDRRMRIMKITKMRRAAQQALSKSDNISSSL